MEEQKFKQCRVCEEVKPIELFDTYKKTGIAKCICRECWTRRSKKYYKDQKEIYLKRTRNYYQKHKEEYSVAHKKYYNEHKEEVRKCARKHREKISKRAADRVKNDPVLKLRARVSNLIRLALQKVNGSKKGKSVMEFLPYGIEVLKKHLEKQFEPWMTWKNYGVFVSGGERRWCIDHIVPQSSFPYNTMEHPNFQKCWALKNLRPLDFCENCSKSDRLLSDLDLAI